MEIYTKTGDKGETSLYDNTRVAKDSIRVESYGTIDELNSTLGLARTFISDGEISKTVFKIQRQLFDVAGELATSDGTTFPEKIDTPEIEELEDIIDKYLARMNEEEKSSFIIPGSNRASASLHQARTICRRAERRIVTLGREAEIREEIKKYVNRLSDVIYTLARFLESRLEYVEFNKDD